MHTGVAAGRDRLEAEAERQQEGHKHSCSDMRTSGDVNSADAANAMQTSKDGKSSVTQPRKRHVSYNVLPCIAIPCHDVQSPLVFVLLDRKLTLSLATSVTMLSQATRFIHK